MNPVIAVRREDKNKWERRSSLTPEHVRRLTAAGIDVHVQSSPIRVFKDEEYADAGASVRAETSDASVVFAIKEIPPDLLAEDTVYAFFSHVHKGQPYNMPMLQKILDLGCTLIDYERITDGSGRRLIFFGRFAGLAGAVETLHALGLRLKWEGLDTPLEQIRQPHTYNDLAEIKTHVKKTGKLIEKNGLPAELFPLVIGVTGYGNASIGAQEIFRGLPVEDVHPGKLASLAGRKDEANRIFLSVFKEEDMVEPKDKGASFVLQDYYDHPEKYRSRFGSHVEHLTAIANCIYWEKKYPRLLTKKFLKQLYSSGRPRLRVIGDISMDIEGSIECTVKSTNPGAPNYVWDPASGRTIDGVRGNGPVISAVDNLPCELPRESSDAFSTALMPFIEPIARADYGVPFDKLALPPEIKRAVIVHKGNLSPDYGYITKFLRH